MERGETMSEWGREYKETVHWFWWSNGSGGRLVEREMREGMIRTIITTPLAKTVHTMIPLLPT
jgi:hypothetical protein